CGLSRGGRGARVRGGAGPRPAGQLANGGDRPRGERGRRVAPAARCGGSRGPEMRPDVWLVIVGMAVAAYLTRAPMFLALAHRPLPPRGGLLLRLGAPAPFPAPPGRLRARRPRPLGLGRG